MSIISKDDVVWAIRLLHPRWSEMLGDDGATAAESLVAVAEGDADNATRAVTLLVALFEEHDALDAVREEINALELGGIGGGEKLYDPLAGRIGPVATTGIAYRCPVEPCHVTWRPQMAGQRIPRCAEHGQLLVPK